MSAGDAKMPDSADTTPAVYSTKATTTAAALKHESSSQMTNGTTKLSSLTPARDLTLGGRGSTTGASKKVFLPNLNVVRNKNANVKTSKDTTITRGKGRGVERGAGGRGGSSRGGRGGSSALIQTTGVFSEGAGALNVRKYVSSSGYSRDADDAPSAMRKPTIFHSEKKLDLKAVLANDKEILKVLDDDCDEDEHKADLDRTPVQLREPKWKYIKPDVKVEVPSLDDANGMDAVAIASQIQAMHVAQQQLTSVPRYPESIQQFLDNTQTQIFVMQLPDTLPCVDEDVEFPDPAKPMENSNSSTIPADNQKPVKQHILKKLEEGQVGRLIRYKSGKTKLILGEIQFDLEIGTEAGFLQDVMSITCNREERSGNMIRLGPIQAKITATPDWEHLFNQRQADDGL